MAKKEKKTKPQRKIVKKATKAKPKKHWHAIIAPKSFNNALLGDSHVDTIEKLVGKSVTINLMHLTNDMRKQGIEIRFDVVKVQDGKGLAVVTGYEVLPSHMKRVVRRGRSKVADSFIVRLGRDRLVRIKPMVFTATRASKGAQTAIRKLVRQRIKELLVKSNFDTLVQDLIGYKIQRALKESASKIHPIKSVEIKACYLLEKSVEAREVDGELLVEEEPKEEKVEEFTETGVSEGSSSSEVKSDESKSVGRDSDAKPEEDLSEEAEGGVVEPSVNPADNEDIKAS